MANSSDKYSILDYRIVIQLTALTCRLNLEKVCVLLSNDRKRSPNDQN